MSARASRRPPSGCATGSPRPRGRSNSAAGSRGRVAGTPGAARTRLSPSNERPTLPLKAAQRKAYACSSATYVSPRPSAIGVCDRHPSSSRARAASAHERWISPSRAGANSGSGASGPWSSDSCATMSRDVDPPEDGAGLERPGEVGFAPAGEVVHHRDVVAAGKQRVDEMGAYETGSAGDQRPHARASVVG